MSINRVIKPKFIPGDPWKYCDSCGVKYRASETKKNWKGLVQCEKCFDHKHPALEPITAGYDNILVEDPRPLGDPVFITTAITYDDL